MAIQDYLYCFSHKRVYDRRMQTYRERRLNETSRDFPNYKDIAVKGIGCAAMGLTGLAGLVVGAGMATGIVPPDYGAIMMGYAAAIGGGTSIYVTHEGKGDQQVSKALTQTADVEEMFEGKKSFGIAKFAWTTAILGIATATYHLSSIAPPEADIADDVIYLTPALYAMWNIVVAECNAGRDFLSEMIKSKNEQ